jgi:hypothetical protein
LNSPVPLLDWKKVGNCVLSILKSYREMTMVLRLFVSVLLLLVAVHDAMASKRVALVIANGDYTNLPKLDKVLTDSRSLRVTLEEALGFDVIYGENLGRREMNRKINELDTQVQQGDIVFIYFAGHGVALDGQNYLLPVDMQQPESGEEQFVISDSFSANELTRKLQAKKVAATFAVLDASHNNPFERQNIGLKKGLVKMDVPDGVFVLFSAAQGQASLDTLSDSDHNPNSVFMRSLLPLLKTPGLTQIDLAKTVQDKVSTAAAAAGHEQKPVYVDRFLDLVILNSGAGEISIPGKSPTENPAYALEEWKIVKDSGNRSALEGFKAKYGSDPVWGPLVNQALAKLTERPQQKSVIVKPRKTVTLKKRTTRPQPSRSCWVCTTYDYTSERVCLPSRVGNPGQRVPPYINCRRG